MHDCPICGWQTAFIWQKPILNGCWDCLAAGATDVSTVSLAGSSTLPEGVVPVSKTLVADMTSIIRDAGAPVGEKMESLTFGPRLLDGSYAALILTDNDFSVTQNDASVQSDVCAVWGTTQNVEQVSQRLLSVLGPMGRVVRQGQMAARVGNVLSSY